jgi:hypothetical protein
MQVFTISGGKKVVIVYDNIVIDGVFYYFDDLIDLVKNGKLTIDDHSLIVSAFSGMPPSDQSINEYARSEDVDVRFILAHLGYALDIIVSDPDPTVRAEVANNGYGLDKLINDPHHVVRLAVAEQGYGLDILINDDDPYVREVAKKAMSEQNKMMLNTGRETKS